MNNAVFIILNPKSETHNLLGLLWTVFFPSNISGFMIQTVILILIMSLILWHILMLSISAAIKG